MLSSKQIPGFLHHQYVLKESVNALDYSHGASHQGKGTSENATFSWDFSGMSSHSQTFNDLPGVFLGHLDGTTRLKIVQNEILIIP